MRPGLFSRFRRHPECGSRRHLSARIRRPALSGNRQAGHGPHAMISRLRRNLLGKRVNLSACPYRHAARSISQEAESQPSVALAQFEIEMHAFFIAIEQLQRHPQRVAFECNSRA